MLSALTFSSCSSASNCSFNKFHSLVFGSLGIYASKPTRRRLWPLEVKYRVLRSFHQPNVFQTRESSARPAARLKVWEHIIYN